MAIYATCPRQYEYAKMWNVSTPEETRRYFDRGNVYHGVIEDACEQAHETNDISESEIREFVRGRTDERWEAETDRSEYRSDAQFAYDRQLVETALESYLDDCGVEHIRNSVATEAWLQCERDGLHLHGRVDNIVRTDEGLQIIDYKGGLNGIVSWQSMGAIEAHHNGEEYDPSRLKSVFQAATYIEGAKQLDVYEDGMEVEFTFYGLLAKKDRTPDVDGLQVIASGYARDVGKIYHKNKELIWAVIRDCYHGIDGEEYVPEPWLDIREHSCDDCEYQAMCGEFLASEVRLDE